MTFRRSAAAACCIAFASASPSLQAKPWELIRADGEISVCANPNALPYSSNKPDAPGFQLEIARALAERLGVRLRTEWIIPRMRASTVDCDLLMDTIAVPGVHPPSIKLSGPYYRGGVPLAFGRDQPAAPTYRALKEGTRVGVIMNSLASLVISKTAATMIPFGFESDMLEALARGEIAAAAASAASIGYFNLKNPEAKLQLVHAEDDEPELRWPVAIGMRRADDELAQKVNAALAQLLADETIARIYARYGVEHRTPGSTP
jgi:ABC-type amino acid transport substrate-binding protein